MLVLAVMGSERVLAPGIDVMLEVVRMAVNKQFPTLMTTLYAGSLASDLKPSASLGMMWKPFNDFKHKKTPAVNGEHFFSLPFYSMGARSSVWSGRRPVGHGRGEGRVPSQSPSWQTICSHSTIIMSLLCQSMIPLTLCLTIYPTPGH